MPEAEAARPVQAEDKGLSDFKKSLESQFQEGGASEERERAKAETAAPKKSEGENLSYAERAKMSAAKAESAKDGERASKGEGKKGSKGKGKGKRSSKGEKGGDRDGEAASTSDRTDSKDSKPLTQNNRWANDDEDRAPRRDERDSRKGGGKDRRDDDRRPPPRDDRDRRDSGGRWDALDDDRDRRGGDRDERPSFRSTDVRLRDGDRKGKGKGKRDDRYDDRRGGDRWGRDDRDRYDDRRGGDRWDDRRDDPRDRRSSWRDDDRDRRDDRDDRRPPPRDDRDYRRDDRDRYDDRRDDRGYGRERYDDRDRGYGGRDDRDRGYGFRPDDRRSSYGKGGGYGDRDSKGKGKQDEGAGRGQYGSDGMRRGDRDQGGFDASYQAPESWYKRADARQNYADARGPGYEEPEENIFPPKRAGQTGINFDDYDKIPVERSGDDCDRYAKIERFSEARLNDELFENVQRCGYERPTPIQKHSIPIIRGGRDLMGCAQTGSGKTAAFLLPAIQSMLDKGPPPPVKQGGGGFGGRGGGQWARMPMPIVLILAPTRELATQIFEEARKFTYKTGMRTAVVYGGAPLHDQKRDLAKGVDILVATPGRGTHMCEANWVSLGYVRYLVLDEADRMLDMGFEPQVRQIVDELDMGRFYYNAPGMERQTLMFSATFADEIQVLARDFLDNYVFLTVGRVGSTNESITQKLVYSAPHEKATRLKKTLQDYCPSGNELCLVFVDTKKGADHLEETLWHQGLKVAAIHGDRSQAEREEALDAFRTGRNPVLIATDVAARGLDIPNVTLVINYDMPKNIDDYVHRIGRTGRAGRLGTAVAFVNEQCSRDILKKLNDLLSEAKQETPDWFEELARVNVQGYVSGRSGKGGTTKDIRAQEGGKGFKTYKDYENGAGGSASGFGGPQVSQFTGGSSAGGVRQGPTQARAVTARAAQPASRAPAAKKSAPKADSWGASGNDDAW